MGQKIIAHAFYSDQIHLISKFSTFLSYLAKLLKRKRPFNNCDLMPLSRSNDFASNFVSPNFGPGEKKLLTDLSFLSSSFFLLPFLS